MTAEDVKLEAFRSSGSVIKKLGADRLLGLGMYKKSFRSA